MKKTPIKIFQSPWGCLQTAWPNNLSSLVSPTVQTPKIFKIYYHLRQRKAETLHSFKKRWNQRIWGILAWKLCKQLIIYQNSCWLFCQSTNWSIALTYNHCFDSISVTILQHVPHTYFYTKIYWSYFILYITKNSKEK